MHAPSHHAGAETTRAARATRDALRLPLESLPDPLPIAPLPGEFHVTVTPPGSKSITNRMLLLAALARGESVLRRPLVDADDARVMVRALAQLGADILLRQENHEQIFRVIGVAGRPIGGVTLNLNNSGTSIRFLTAAAALANGPVVLDGDERMRQRPIDELSSALRAMRIRVEDLGKRGFPPLRVTPADAEQLPGGAVTIASPKSSQFVSALMLVAPWTARGVEINITGEVTSKPYIRMTADLLRAVGADVSLSPDCAAIRVGPRPIEPFDTRIEPDASGAVPFWTAALITPGASLRVPGVGWLSMQGDARFVNTLAAMGATVEAAPDAIAVEAPPDDEPLRGVRADMAATPDAAMALAAAACFATTPTTITGLRTLRDKECDRIEATRAELTKLGARVEAADASLRITPPEAHTADAVVFDTYNDHRMAMALALIGLRRPGVSIRDPRCVAKTYPEFWSDLARLYDAAL